MENIIFKQGSKYCTKKDLIKALESAKDDDLILISNGYDFFTLKEISYDEINDVVIRTSDNPYN